MPGRGAHSGAPLPEGSRFHQTHQIAHPVAAASAIAVGAVVFLAVGLVVGTLRGPDLLREYVPSLAGELGMTEEAQAEVERLDDGYGGELARRVAAVSSDLARSAVSAPSLDEATAGALQGLVSSSDPGARYLDAEELAAAEGGVGGATGVAAGGRAVTTETRGSVGVIAIASFETGVSRDVEAAVADFKARGVTSLVLDLRGNAGGSLREAVDTASLFLRGGTVAEVVSGDGSSRRLAADAGRQAAEGPLAVLVSDGTGSVAEAFAAALQEHRRAVVVGQATAGDASVRSLRTLSFGGAVVFATATFLTPDGNDVSGTGVAPDLVVARPASGEAFGEASGDGSGYGSGPETGSESGSASGLASGSADAASPTAKDTALDAAADLLASWAESGGIEGALQAARRLSAAVDDAASGAADLIASMESSAADGQAAPETSADDRADDYTAASVDDRAGASSEG